MTETQRAAMQQALEALERGQFKGELIALRERAIGALEAALAESERKRRTVKESLTDDGWKRTREICS